MQRPSTATPAIHPQVDRFILTAIVSAGRRPVRGPVAPARPGPRQWVGAAATPVTGLPPVAQCPQRAGRSARASALAPSSPSLVRSATPGPQQRVRYLDTLKVAVVYGILLYHS